MIEIGFSEFNLYKGYARGIYETKNVRLLYSESLINYSVRLFSKWRTSFHIVIAL